MPDLIPIRSVRLTDADWSALQRIASARGLLWGGSASRGAAIVWLIRREVRRIEKEEAKKEARR